MDKPRKVEILEASEHLVDKHFYMVFSELLGRSNDLV